MVDLHDTSVITNGYLRIDARPCDEDLRILLNAWSDMYDRVEIDTFVNLTDLDGPPEVIRAKIDLEGVTPAAEDDELPDAVVTYMDEQINA